MEAVESGPVRQCPPGLIYLETVMSRMIKWECHWGQVRSQPKTGSKIRAVQNARKVIEKGA
jgi:hypothetical protein